MTTYDPHHPHHDDPPDRWTAPGWSTDRPRALRDCRPGEVVTTELGQTVVLLHPTTARPHTRDHGEPRALSRYDLVEVHAGGRVVHLPAEALVTPVTDPAVQLDAVRAAVDALAHRHRADVHTQDTARAQHTRLMDDLRAFAIERHLAGDTDAGELNQFLHHFGLPTYQPRLQVRFTITGTFDITGEPEDNLAVEDEARRHLRVHFDDLDDLIPGSPTVAIHIDDVTALDT